MTDAASQDHPIWSGLAGCEPRSFDLYVAQPRQRALVYTTASLLFRLERRSGGALVVDPTTGSNADLRPANLRCDSGSWMTESGIQQPSQTRRACLTG